MQTRFARTLSQCLLALLVPCAITMYASSRSVVSLSVAAMIVDVEMHQRLGHGDKYHPPHDETVVTPKVQYQVDGKTYKRRLPSSVVNDIVIRDLQEIRTQFIGTTRVIRYDPSDPGSAPPLQWRSWILSGLLIIIAFCLIPWLLVVWSKIFIHVDARPNSGGNRRVLTGKEYLAKRESAKA